MAGLRQGIVYFTNLNNALEAGAIGVNDKAIFTTSGGVWAVDGQGTVVRLDNDVSGDLAGITAAINDLSAALIPVYRGVLDLNTSSNIFTVSHNSVIIQDTTPIVSLNAPSDNSVLYVAAIRNRSTTSFDVLLSDTPEVTGYSLNWLLVGESMFGGSSGSVSGGTTIVITSNPDLIGSGTRVITAQESIVPSLSGVYDLGSIDKPWKELHLTGNTIYMGGIAISVSGSSLMADRSMLVDTNTLAVSASSLHGRITTVDNKIKSNGQVNYTIQVGTFSAPQEGQPGDLVYIVD